MSGHAIQRYKRLCFSIYSKCRALVHRNRSSSDAVRASFFVVRGFEAGSAGMAVGTFVSTSIRVRVRNRSTLLRCKIVVVSCLRLWYVDCISNLLAPRRWSTGAQRLLVVGCLPTSYYEQTLSSGHKNGALREVCSRTGQTPFSLQGSGTRKWNGNLDAWARAGLGTEQDGVGEASAGERLLHLVSR